MKVHLRQYNQENAITGCDVVSSFNGKGKKSAFALWKVCPQVNAAFIALGRGEIDDSLPEIEKFVVIMYDRVSDAGEVNECCRSVHNFFEHAISMPSFPKNFGEILVIYAKGEANGRASTDTKCVGTALSSCWLPGRSRLGTPVGKGEREVTVHQCRITYI